MKNSLYDPAFERSLLSSIIFNPEIFENIKRTISKNDFYSSAHQNIFKAMDSLYETNNPIDEAFIKKELGSEFEENVMLDILYTNPISDISAYISEILNKSFARNTLIFSNDLKKLLHDDSFNNEDILNMISKYLDQQSKSINSLIPRNFNDILKQMKDEKLLSTPKRLTPIDNTSKLFYHGGMHAIHGLSKHGKSYFVLSILNSAKNVEVLWIDGDDNEQNMAEQFANIHHLPPLNADSYFDKWINTYIDFTNVIFIIDSLKDFTNNQDMDSNNGMNTIIKRFKQLTKYGATVIVIMHSTTIYEDKKTTIKIKGNAEAVYSNTDITYRIESIENSTNQKIITCERSRIDMMPTGSIVYSKDGHIKDNNSNKNNKDDIYGCLYK